MNPLMYTTVPYRVKKGENLTKIARQNNTDVQSILRVNPELTNPDRIFTGQEIRLPIPPELMGEMMPMGPRMNPMEMLGMQQVPLPDPSRMESHPMQPDPEQLMQQLGMGAMAGAAPMAAMAGPAMGGAAMGGLGRLATMAPRLPPAGRVDMPGMTRGAVPHGGGMPAMNNVRPVGPNPGADRAITQSALQQMLQHGRRQNMGPRGMDRIMPDPETLALIR